MKRVVERVQRENEELKKAPGILSNEKMITLEQENVFLKVANFNLKTSLLKNTFPKIVYTFT